MNKVVLLLMLVALIVSCNSKPDKNNTVLKNETISYCEKTAIQEGMSESKKELVKKYCTCSSEKMLGEFTYAEMMQMKNPTPELKLRLEKLVEPCLKDLTINLDEMDKKKK
ncbi:hypothetical protein [Chishuiella sp.]|uniref:hypothetical protein n=1 Tax=Chishuiella sp. TaxID=1969467 RepID=UPI0028AFDC86|nr:hypothetical protein [Chishuiella sp.]